MIKWLKKFVDLLFLCSAVQRSTYMNTIHHESPGWRYLALLSSLPHTSTTHQPLSTQLKYIYTIYSLLSTLYSLLSTLYLSYLIANILVFINVFIHPTMIEYILVKLVKIVNKEKYKVSILCLWTHLLGLIRNAIPYVTLRDPGFINFE